ncbi:nucleoside diphosphate kinase [Entophlyctis helioformis]|nr:nucleoside diphosphate kinase [Entophlyctis helioformis]
MESTLVLIKPDAVPRKNDIEDRFKQAGYKVLQTRTVRLTEEQATDFYQEDLDDPNFSRLVAYMTSGPTVVMNVQKLSLYEEIQSFVGPKHPDIGRSLNPNCLRAVFGGKDELHNAIHYSEDILTARRELHFFFPDAIVDPIPSMDHAKLFLETAIYPTLLQGLTELCKEKPADPIAWLGEWLEGNNPLKPMIQQA